MPPVSLSIYGAGTGTDPDTNTILTGSDSTQSWTSRASITVTLSSMRFTNGYGTYGGGIYMNGKAVEVTVTDCVFTESDGEYGGRDLRRTRHDGHQQLPVPRQQR